MSAIAESLRRGRLPLLTIAAVLVLGVIAWAMVADTTAQHLRRSEPPAAAPAVQQADWRIAYSAEGRFGKLSEHQKQRYAAQKAKVASLVRSVYGGIFLDRSRLDRIIKESFSAAAARSIHAGKLGFPDGATAVKTTKRRAHIALDAETADFAIGRVGVVAEAGVGKRTVDVQHRSTLWMERSDAGWKVIAFDLEQRPVK